MQQTTPTPPAAKPAKPKPPEPPPEFQEGVIATMSPADLIALLKDTKTTEFQKAKACVRLGELGAKEAVPALAALLDDEHLSVYARYGLEPIEDASVDDALRAALLKMKGVRQIGVVNSLGERRDARAGAALAKLLHGADADLARAAASALGKIGNEASVKELQTAYGGATGLTKTAVADASLVCCERLLAAGKRDQALAFYATLTGPENTKPIRLAAMSAIVRAETRAVKAP